MQTLIWRSPYASYSATWMDFYCLQGNVERILKVSEKYDIPLLQQQCATFLSAASFSGKPQDESYVWRWLEIADKMAMQDVIDNCIISLDCGRDTVRMCLLQLPQRETAAAQASQGSSATASLEQHVSDLWCLIIFI